MRKFLRFSLMSIFMLVSSLSYADAYKTLTFPDDAKNKVGSYTLEWTAKIGTDEWAIANFNNNNWGWANIRCGRKSDTSIASIATNFAIDKAIANVTLTSDKALTATQIGKIKSIKLIVASDDKFENKITTVELDKSNLSTAGNLSFAIQSPTGNAYYKIEFDMDVMGTNGVIQISKVQYLEAGAVSLDPAQITFSKTSFTAYLDGENTFPTFSNPNNLAVTFDSSDKNVATIDAEGNVTILAKGTTTISAKSEETDKYEAGNASYTLTVKPQPVAVNTAETAFTVAEALKQIEDWTASTEKVYVKGKISKIDEVSTQYGNATYFISDDGTETNQLEVYRGYYLNNEKFTAADQIHVGDEVIVYGVLINYNTTPEINQNNYLYSHNGKTTGISEIAVDNAKTSPVYNTAGQRVDSAYKGIVIKNGKKVLVK